MNVKKKRIKQKHQSNIIQLLMFRYFPYWPLFLGLAIILFAAAWIYLKVASPIYEITATILIKDEKKGVEDPRMVESLNIYTSKKIVENEIEVIKSKTLMRETVEVLHLSSPVFEERLLSSHSAYTTSPVAVEIKDIYNFKEATRVNFSYDWKQGVITFQNKQYQINEWIISPYGEIRFVRNIHLKNPSTGPFYFSLIDPRNVTNALIANFNVHPSNKLSTVLNLAIYDAVPERGENVLNTLMESYNKAAISDKNSLAANTLEFVEERIRFIEHDLDSVEQSIQRYKSARGIVDLSAQGKLFLQNVGDNDQKLSELNMQMAVLDRVENYVVKKRNSAGIVPSTLGIKDDRLSLLIQNLYESEIRYERLKKTTAENNPILLSLQNEIENMRPGILENIRNQRSSLSASRSNVTSTNNKYASVLETIPQQERELLEANRQQAIKNNVYTFLLQKREETTLSYASAVSDSRLVDKAESSLIPVAPNRRMIYAAALGFAFFLGMAWVITKELFNSNVLFRSEIESLTRIPISSEISYSDLKDYVIIENPKRPFLTEQFRQLRVTLGLYGNTTKKILMVTSAVGGEGKSFISANFSTSLVRSDKKVLLLDMDLRNPGLSHFYNVATTVGVSEFLNGEVAMEDVIRRTIIPNLFIIGAGKKRTNPMEILLNGNLQKLFENLRELFDYVIVDTAPIDPVIDGYLISPYCDMTLFVVRHGKTPKAILQLLDENIKMKAFNDISIVFNGVRPRGLIKSAYGYGYGYGYEYVYSDRQKNKKLVKS